MRPSVLTKTLRDWRRALAGWILGITAVGCLYAAFFTTVNTPEMARALEAYPKGLLVALGFTDVTSAAGYLGSTTFGILGPILVLVFATALGGGAIAGDEEGGRLDLTLAHPVSRWSVLVQRFAALVIAMLASGVILAAALVAISGPAGLQGVGPGNLLAASLQLSLFGVIFGVLALAVGAASGRRSVVNGVLAVVGVLSFFANNLAATIEGLEWTRSLSPFFYMSGGAPLRNGLQVDDALVLVAASLVLLIAGGLVFDRRDIAV
jgi:ABC-2 type transport system permease protein